MSKYPFIIKYWMVIYLAPGSIIGLQRNVMAVVSRNVIAVVSVATNVVSAPVHARPPLFFSCIFKVVTAWHSSDTESCFIV